MLHAIIIIESTFSRTFQDIMCIFNSYSKVSGEVSNLLIPTINLALIDIKGNFRPLRISIIKQGRGVEGEEKRDSLGPVKCVQKNLSCSMVADNTTTQHLDLSQVEKPEYYRGGSFSVI